MPDDIRITLTGEDSRSRGATLSRDAVGGSLTCNVAIRSTDRITPASKDDAEKLAAHYTAAAALFKLPKRGHKRTRSNRVTVKK